MLSSQGIDQRNAKATGLKINLLLISFSFSLESSRGLRAICLAAEPTSKEIPRMVKCQVVSFAKGNVAIVFPFGEFFLGAEFFGGAGEGESQAQFSFQHACIHRPCCSFPKGYISLLGGHSVRARHTFPRPLPKVCFVFPEPLERQTLLAPQQPRLASTRLRAEFGPVLSCQFNVPFHRHFPKKHDLHSPFHNKS